MKKTALYVALTIFYTIMLAGAFAVSSTGSSILGPTIAAISVCLFIVGLGFIIDPPNRS
jgi:hypothetical protein